MLPIRKNLARGSTVAVGLFASVFVFVASAPLKAQTPVVFGDVITEPGVYFLLGNQTGSGTGIRIESDDVALLLLRFTLRGNGSDVGIYCAGHDNVTIYGGRVTNFKLGIDLEDGDDCTLKDLRVDHSSLLAGISLRRMSDSWFLRLRCDYNGGNGLEALGCEDNRFISILAHDNGRHGILLDNGLAFVTGELGSVGETQGNKLRLCWAAYNGLDGINLHDSSQNDLERNQCVANRNAGIRIDTLSDDQPGDEAQGPMPTPGSHDNFLRSNWCVFNDDGIIVEWGATSNTMTNNTALANFHRDLIDENNDFPCANTWFLNFFLLKGGAGEACIF